MNKRTLRKLVGIGVVVAAVGAGAAAVSAGSESSGSFRTATASTQSVDQVLSAVGTIEPVSQASVAFPVSGTVDSVLVETGDTVVVGQPLATLDVEDLTVSLHEAQATLAQANLLLQRALDGEDVSAEAGGAPQGGLGRSSSSGGNAALTAAQQAVLDAQSAVTDAMATAEAALASAADVCTTTGTTDPTETTTTTSDVTTSADADTASCQQALQASLEAQRAVTAAQQDLDEAMAALNQLLADLAEDLGSSTTTTTTTPSTPSTPTTPSGPSSSGTPSGSTSTGSGAPSGSTSGATTSSSPSAEELVAYQKDVDAATLGVAVAQQALDQATIVSPIDGTVASVGLDVGDEVEAASATQAVLVVADGGYEVTTKVSVTDLADLEVGQAATVAPDGQHEPIDGEIVRIGVAPDSGTSTYSVTIGLTGATGDLGNGSTASIAITTAASTDALAVPTSAVTVDGTSSTVQLLVDDEPVVTEVETGAVGQTWTEITDGIDDGDVVVLADLDEPLPGSATDTSSNGSTGTGEVQFPGGGGFTGGPPSFGGGARGGG